MQDIEAAPPVTDEVTRLRQQLAERELAVMRAILTNTELQQKIADSEDQSTQLKKQVQQLEARPTPEAAMAEITRLKKEWTVTQRAQQREHATRRTELVKLRAQLHQAQKQAEDESRARRSDAAHSSSTIMRLERDLGDMRTAAKKTREEVAREHKAHWRFVSAAIAAAVVVCGIALFGPTGWRPGATVAASSTTAAAAAGGSSQAAHGAQLHAIPPGSLQLPPQSSAFALTNGPEFSRSVNRLSDALSSIQGETPQQILSEVHLAKVKEEPGLCAFQWNNGQPALMLGADHANGTITSSLNRCAQAVEAYRGQKFAALNH